MKKIKKILGLNLKWVKVMLSTSVVAILVLTLYPDTQILTYETLEMPINKHAMEAMPEMLAESRDTVAIKNKPIIIDTPESQPIQIQVITESQPFDWKGMISWVIGAVNGLVLLVMNIKNIRKK